MKIYSVLHLGPGNVGSAFAHILRTQRRDVESKYEVDLRYAGVFRSQGGKFNKDGLTEQELCSDNWPTQFEEAMHAAEGTVILVDTTSSEETVSLMKQVLEKGGYVVMANKKPVSGTMETFKMLTETYAGNVRFETTVGAGLPVLNTLLGLVESDDRIEHIQGCFSGTLGYLASELEKGVPYSEAVHKAKQFGYTEPDPRDDLSGMDVARKALILARVCGNELEMKDVHITPFYEEQYANGTVEEFMKAIAKSNDIYAAQMAKALHNEDTLRYVADIQDDTVKVSLKVVPKQSPLGSLEGPDNIISLQSKAYNNNPLVIRGPGAGAQVTAIGVFSDVLACIR